MILKFTLPVFLLFASLLASAQSDKYMIYFKDKNGSPFSVSTPSAYLSSRAIQRRQTQNIPIQLDDLPVNQTYISQVAAVGVTVLNRSKWFNAISIQTSDTNLINAIKGMSFSDAKSILMGNESAATDFLKGSTSAELYTKFSPVIQKSIGKVGADKIWATIIKKYNTIPMITKVNPDITDYVTNKSMDGVFKMISVEEKNIRTNLNSRTSETLKKVFAMQDKK